MSSELKEIDSNNDAQEVILGKSRNTSPSFSPREPLKETQPSRRHSKRLASQAGEKAFRSTEFRDVKRPRRLLGLASVSAENGNELVKSGKSTNEIENGRRQKLLRAAAKSRILRRSTRLASISSGAGKELNDTTEGITRLSTVKASKIVCPKGKSCRTAASPVEIKKGVTIETISKEKKAAEGLREDKVDSVVVKIIEDGRVKMKNKKNHMVKSRKVEKNCTTDTTTGTMETGKCLGSMEWTSEQEAALQKAYLVAKPSPHFWKKVSRMV